MKLFPHLCLAIMLTLACCKHLPHVPPDPVDPHPPVDSYAVVPTKVYYYRLAADTVGYPYIDSIYYKPGLKIDSISTRHRGQWIGRHDFRYNASGDLEFMLDTMKGDYYEDHYQYHFHYGAGARLDSIVIDDLRSEEYKNYLTNSFFYDANGHVNGLNTHFLQGGGVEGPLPYGMLVDSATYYRNATGTKLDSIHYVGIGSYFTPIRYSYLNIHFAPVPPADQPGLDRAYLFMMATRNNQWLTDALDLFLFQYINPDQKLFTSGTTDIKTYYVTDFQRDVPFYCNAQYDTAHRIQQLTVMHEAIPYAPGLVTLRFLYGKVNKYK